MARTNLVDYLQAYPFWLMDVAPIEPLALPIFTPLLGFSAITSPEMTTDVFEVNEANWYFSKKVLKKAAASNMTLTRASSWMDGDFYAWMMAGLTGYTGGQGGPDQIPSGAGFAAAQQVAPLSSSLQIGGPTPRRDLLLIHFLSRSPIPAPGHEIAAAAGLLAVQGIAAANGGLSVAGGLAAAGGLALAGAAAAGFGASFGPVEFAPRLPAKAWMLYGCVPTRYKAGSDFDATSSAVSLMELEVAVEYWDEISLGSSIGSAAAVLAQGIAEAL